MKPAEETQRGGLQALKGQPALGRAGGHPPWSWHSGSDPRATADTLGVDSIPQAWFPPALVTRKVTCSLWGRCAFETDELKDSRQLGKASAPCPTEGPSSSSWNQGTEVAHRYTHVHIPPFPGSRPHQGALSSRREISHVFQEALCRNRGGNLYPTLG